MAEVLDRSALYDEEDDNELNEFEEANKLRVHRQISSRLAEQANKKAADMLVQQGAKSGFKWMINRLALVGGLSIIGLIIPIIVYNIQLIFGNLGPLKELKIEDDQILGIKVPASVIVIMVVMLDCAVAIILGLFFAAIYAYMDTVTFKLLTVLARLWSVLTGG